MPNLAHKDDYYETPPIIVTNIEKETGLKFDIDISASVYNAKCDLFMSENTNALKVDWIPYYCNQKVPNAYENISKSEGVLAVFCNPPRSKNGKFVIRALEEWKKLDINIVMLLCWNDLGNKYCDQVRENLFNGTFGYGNLGKIAFYKDGKPVYNIDKKTGKQVEFPSRLSYFWCWFKSTHNI